MYMYTCKNGYTKGSPLFGWSSVYSVVSDSSVLYDLSFTTEQKTTPQGQVYFIHRATGVSTWHDPRFRDVAVDPNELGPLPDGWEVRYTAHGRKYFVDHLRRTTQFTGAGSVSFTSCQCAGSL